MRTEEKEEGRDTEGIGKSGKMKWRNKERRDERKRGRNNVTGGRNI